MAISDHLPEWMNTYVEQVSGELQVPQDAVALLSLGALSVAVNGGATTMPVDSWAEPAVLYTLALLPSGEGKSPVFNKLLDPVRRAFEEVTGIQQAADAEYQTLRNEMNRRHIKQLKAKVLRQVDKGQMSLEEAIAEVRQAEKAISQFHNLNVPLKILTNTTQRALFDSLRDSNGRLVIATPEAEGVTNFKGSSKDVILNGFDGDQITIARADIGELTITRPTITMMVAMQPTVLGTLGSDMTDRGLMPRFLFSYPESLLGHRAARTLLTTPEAEEAYEFEMTRIVREFSERTAKLITWNKDAKKEIGLWREEIEPHLAPEGSLGAIAAWGSKVRGGHFIRLSALMAIAQGREFVTPDDCHRAKGILRSLMVDAKRAFGAMGAAITDDDVTHLMSIVERLPNPDSFVKRDAMRRSNRLKTADRSEAAFEAARDQGLLTTDPVTKRWSLVR